MACSGSPSRSGRITHARIIDVPAIAEFYR
jgi:hypothetical protein